MKYFSFFVVAVSLTVACSSSSSSNGGGNDSGTDTSGGITIDQACTDSAHARCTKIQTCSAIWLAELYGDEATCETRVKTTCGNALNAPNNANDPAATEACVAAISGWSCGDFLLNANIPTACAQKLGPAANGAACSAAGQCQTGFCEISTAACGACQAGPTAGQPCSATYQCAIGLTCASNKMCVAPAASGATCSASQTCAPGLRCSTGKCVAVDSTVAVGQPCGDVGGKSVGCTSGTCDKGTCVARAADGAACDLMAGPYCIPGALCVGGTCRLPTCP